MWSGTTVGCNCAVAVRAEDDVILIDSCGPRSNPFPERTLAVTSYINGEMTAGLRIVAFGGGDYYEV